MAKDDPKVKPEAVKLKEIDYGLFDYTTECQRQDKRGLPHSMYYTTAMTEDVLVERWQCHNCITQMMRTTVITGAPHFTAVHPDGSALTGEEMVRLVCSVQLPPLPN